MRNKLLFTVLAVALTMAALSRAALADDQVVAPFIDDQTAMVIRLDTSRLDIDAFFDWELARAKTLGEPALASAKQIEEVRKAATDPASESAKFIQALRQAKCVYWVVSLAEFTGAQDESGPPGLWIVPEQNGAEAKLLIQFLDVEKSHDPMDHSYVPMEHLVSEHIGICWVLHEPKREVKPNGGEVKLPEAWKAALTGEDGVAVQVAVVPSDVLRKSFEENMPNLPTPGKPTPITVLTHGLRWESSSLLLPPNPSLVFRIQAADADSAKAMGDLVQQVVPLLPAQMGLADADAKLLTPTVKGDQLVWAFDSDAINLRLGPKLMFSVGNARAAGMLEQSTVNIRLLLMFCFRYAAANKGRFPDDLASAIKGTPNASDAHLINPRQPDRKPGYIYISPGDMKNVVSPQDRLVIYESFDKWPGSVGVGFADGHVEVISSEEKFDKLLAAAKQGAPQTKPAGP